MARVVMVGSTGHAEDERQVAPQLAQIRARSREGRRHLGVQPDDKTLTETHRTPDATRVHALRRRAFALACRRQMLSALTAGEAAAVQSSVATLLNPLQVDPPLTLHG